MANPNPQHNPTDGLAVAAYVQVTGGDAGNQLTNLSLGAAKVQGTTGAPLGQGIGAGMGSTNHPQAQYHLTLSLAHNLVNGVQYIATCQLTTVIKDVANTTYTPRIGSPVYKSYGDPVGAWYNPSNGISGNGLLANQVAYSALVASVSLTGLITALHVGQCIVEVQFPVFDNVMTPETDHDTADPTQMIYAQIVVDVIP
jgi:hypothetical protein